MSGNGGFWSCFASEAGAMCARWQTVYSSKRILHGDTSLTLDEIISATNKEDLLCIELVEEIGQKLGRYLAGLINLLNPELVIIGGVLAQTGDIFCNR